MIAKHTAEDIAVNVPGTVAQDYLIKPSMSSEQGEAIKERTQAALMIVMDSFKRSKLKRYSWMRLAPPRPMGSRNAASVTRNGSYQSGDT
jgi:hypothetical protein